MALALVTVSATVAYAQDNPAGATKSSVAIQLAQFKVVKTADGAEQLIDAAKVRPGDLIEYRAVYTNNGTKPVSKLVANLPIPEGLEYLPSSAKPGGAAVSMATKDGVYASEPLTRIVQGKSQPVPYAEYRSLRWSIGKLEPGGSTTVSARAKVEAAAVVATPSTSSAAGASSK